jgi:outer membrane protein OmpA-like peptidoglycan-associated protein
MRWQRGPVVGAILLATVLPVAAQAGGINLASLPFTQAVDGGFGVQTVEVLRPGDFDLGVGYQLVLGGGQLRYPSAGGTETISVVDDLHTAALLGSVGLFSRVDLSFQMPMVVASTVGEDFQAGSGALESWGSGDLQINSQIEILPRDRFAVGLAGGLFVTVPFGEQEALRGEGGWTGGARLALDRRFGPLLLAANGGIHVRPARTTLGTTIGSAIEGAFLAQLSVVPEVLSISAGARGAADLEGNENGSPLESFVGLTGHVGSFSLSLGSTIGMNDHLGAAPLRAMAVLGYGYRRIQDRDRDGIADEMDRCPGLAEDADGFADDDGCPDLDDDQDGVPDDRDRCPLQAEDRDGFEDEDGCPDLDNDGDGIPDVDDDCPNEAEDRDGHEDNDGCVDRDNDGDGVPDHMDSCPAEQEIRNGFEDEDGCPDERPRYLFKKGLPTVILEELFVDDSEEISEAGKKVLSDVARSLAVQPGVRIRVEVHTRGVEQANVALDLSRQRALTIMNQLIELGVEPGRLDYVGFGSSQPRPGEAGWGRLELRMLQR